MRRYNVRIDGEVMPGDYSYEELLLNDILDDESNEVKPVSGTKWTKVLSYQFPEENSMPSVGYTVDETGQVHFPSPAHIEKPQQREDNSQFRINEYGEMVERNRRTSSSSGQPRNNPPQQREDNSRFRINEYGEMVERNHRASSSSSQPHNSQPQQTSYSNDDGDGWLVFWTIVIIIVGLCIVFNVESAWTKIMTILGGSWLIWDIWDD